MLTYVERILFILCILLVPVHLAMVLTLTMVKADRVSKIHKIYVTSKKKKIRYLYKEIL